MEWGLGRSRRRNVLQRGDKSGSEASGGRGGVGCEKEVDMFQPHILVIHVMSGHLGHQCHAASLGNFVSLGHSASPRIQAQGRKLGGERLKNKAGGSMSAVCDCARGALHHPRRTVLTRVYVNSTPVELERAGYTKLHTEVL